MPDFIILGECPFNYDGKAAIKAQCWRCRTFVVIQKVKAKQPCEDCMGELKKMGRNYEEFPKRSR